MLKFEFRYTVSEIRYIAMLYALYRKTDMLKMCHHYSRNGDRVVMAMRGRLHAYQSPYCSQLLTRRVYGVPTRKSLTMQHVSTPS